MITAIGCPICWLSCCLSLRLCCALLTSLYMALIDSTGGALTRVEKRRLQAAVQAARGALKKAPSTHTRFASTTWDCSNACVCRGWPGGGHAVM